MRDPKEQVSDNLSEHDQCDEHSNPRNPEEWMVCDFDACYLSGEKREIGKCPWAIANGEGKKDCGYG